MGYPWFLTMLLFLIILGLLTSIGAEKVDARTANELSLDGPWIYQLDPKDVGEASGWTHHFSGEGTVTLPGTSDTLGLGPVTMERSEWRLNRLHRYRGAIWFTREIKVPNTWLDQAVVLELERVQWESRLWVNGQPAGMQDSLSVPHRYDLTQLVRPGVNRITLRIDNRIKYKIHHSYGDWVWLHAITDETQGNWNGVIGRMTLRMIPQVSLDGIRIDAPSDEATAHLRVRISNRTRYHEQVTLRVVIRRGGIRPVDVPVNAPPGSSTHELNVPLRADAPLWDEFSPKRLQVDVTLTRTNGERHSIHEQFGRVSFSAGSRRFIWNGRPVSLRGNLECAIWPLTGHPPMNPEGGWTRLMRVIKQHGMNHLRFHSWCSPEAAFDAADKAGIVLQVELPLWDGYGNLASDPERCVWLKDEAIRIVQEYGNHPSFRLMSMGNELGGPDDPWLTDLVRFLKWLDPRVLYTSTTHPASEKSDDDYHDAAGTAAGVVRGIPSTPSGRPSGNGVFSNSLVHITRPLISHEIGQYSMFFNPEEIRKYTGVMKPFNLEMCRDAMQRNGLLHMAEPFRRSSARFQFSLYKREIETLLATPELAGFQALGLQDFPGQGTTMCGVLDSFWESKGVVSPAEWRRFCAPTVVLARFDESVYTDDQEFTASLQLAHFGPHDLKNASLQWELRAGRRVLAKGETVPQDVCTGTVIELGDMRQPLYGLVRYPAELTLVAFLKGTQIRNSWTIWVYPHDNDPVFDGDVLIADEWNDTVQNALLNGRDVLLLADGSRLLRGVDIRFYPVSWNMLLFSGQPSSIGLHMDPKHPVFSQFPTHDHSDLQWAKLQENANAIDLSGSSINPLLWVIDDFHTAFQRKLGALFGARVLKGRLVVCTLNVGDDARTWPEVRQFLKSVLTYMKSARFTPAQVDVTELSRCLAPRQVAFGTTDTPSGMDRAFLHVRPADNALGATSYDKQMDTIFRSSPGFDYNLHCEVAWTDTRGTAWVGSQMELRIRIPIGVSGRVAVRVADWNRLRRNGRLFWNGRDMGDIGPHEHGRWILLPLDTALGEQVMRLERTSGPNLMITEMAVLPE